MIVEKHVREYINSLNKEEKKELLNMEDAARREHVPIIRQETKEILRFFVNLISPMRILEIGAAIGYSAIIMHECQPEGGTIDTIERNHDRYEKAISNISENGYEDSINVYFGDAVDVLEKLNKDYDMIFMDAAKGQYKTFFELSASKLKKEGLMICDNVLQDGGVALSRYAVTRRDHTVHFRMREFLYELKHDENWDTIVLPVGDGIIISRKKGE